MFDRLAAIPLDRTFYALHTTYQENVEGFLMEFPNVNFTTDAIILDESFNDSFPNTINDDAFQNLIVCQTVSGQSRVSPQIK